PVTRPASPPTVMMHASGGWLRRWWPALAPATVSLACAVVLVVQQMEIGDLRESTRALSAAVTATDTVPSAATAKARNDTPALDSSTVEQQEIARLKQLASQLAAEIGQLEQIQKE